MFFMRRPISARQFRLAVVVSIVTAAVASPALSRQRVPPPEPSRTPWVSAESVQQMGRALEYYRNLTRQPQPAPLPDKTTMRMGDSGQAVADLRARLMATGDLKSRGDPYGFDADVEAAVKRYQLRNGVEPTGIVYGITQRLLNVPLDVRVRQLELNLQRMQQLLPVIQAQQRYILMNAASFELQGIDRGAVAVTSRTIAGKRATPTPVVSAQVQALNTLPYWHVPGTIAKAALIPMIRKDPGYLYKERIRVFSSFGGDEVDPATVNWWGPEAERYVFRQDPGPQNALGVLRFDMPNKHIVYMHDTPMKNLFDYFERAVSAGCVRLQNYYGVADWVLAGQDGLSGSALQGRVAAGQQSTVKLKSPVPVHFIYLTAWVDNGVVHFRNDLYNRDASAFVSGEDVSARPVGVTIAP
ncbi:MAG: L,D-transpeptidase family protein [Hyphomicrobium sp.]|jgi:murein L,D-transpeptidase YcbB/YkuD|nr:L,D-transpeptidase family protein [Hyphomicrobium sp.]